MEVPSSKEGRIVMNDPEGRKKVFDTAFGSGKNHTVQIEGKSYTIRKVSQQYKINPQNIKSLDYVEPSWTILDTIVLVCGFIIILSGAIIAWTNSAW